MVSTLEQNMPHLMRPLPIPGLLLYFNSPCFQMNHLCLSNSVVAYPEITKAHLTKESRLTALPKAISHGSVMIVCSSDCQTSQNPNLHLQVILSWAPSLQYSLIKCGAGHGLPSLNVARINTWPSSQASSAFLQHESKSLAQGSYLDRSPHPLELCQAEPASTPNLSLRPRQ